MLRAMFGMGGSEILVILIVALVFLGPEKLPDAAKQISKGIRDLKRQSRSLQQTIEEDENIGGAIRDLKSALRGELPVDDPPAPKKKPKKKRSAEALSAAVAGAAQATVGADDATQALHAAPGEAAGAATDEATDEAAARATAAVAAGAPPGEPALPPPAGDAPAPRADDAAAGAAEPAGRPAFTLPRVAGEADPDHPETGGVDDLAALVRPATGTIAKGTPLTEPDHG